MEYWNAVSSPAVTTHFPSYYCILYPLVLRLIYFVKSLNMDSTGLKTFCFHLRKLDLCVTFLVHQLSTGVFRYCFCKIHQKVLLFAPLEEIFLQLLLSINFNSPIMIWAWCLPTKWKPLHLHGKMIRYFINISDLRF